MEGIARTVEDTVTKIGKEKMRGIVIIPFKHRLRISKKVIVFAELSLGIGEMEAQSAGIKAKK